MNSPGREGREEGVRSGPLLLLHWPLTLGSSANFQARVISPLKPAFPPTPGWASWMLTWMFLGPQGLSTRPAFPLIPSPPHG